MQTYQQDDSILILVSFFSPVFPKSFIPGLLESHYDLDPVVVGITPSFSLLRLLGMKKPTSQGFARAPHCLYDQLSGKGKETYP